MPQLVFLHGPGAGACADAFHHQVRHFPNSVAPTLPATSRQPVSGRHAIHGMGARLALGAGPEKGPRADRLHAGASIALQYGLDYPDEVKGLC